MTNVAMPLGLSTSVLASPFSDRDVDLFAQVRGWGYDHVEVCIEDLARLTPATDASAASDEGRSVLVCGAFGPDRDVSHEDSARRLDDVDYLRRCIDFAADVGSPQVSGPMYAITGQARLLEPAEQQGQWQRAVDSLANVAEYAATMGVRAAIEPLNRFETDLMNTVEQGLRLCDDIGVDNVGLMIDTFHMNIEEKGLPDAIMSAGARLFSFQASENDRGTPGSGHTQWVEVVAALGSVDHTRSLVAK